MDASCSIACCSRSNMSNKTQDEIRHFQVLQVQASQGPSVGLSRRDSPVPSKTPVSWNDEMNVMLCREVDYINPFQFKERTKERGKCWEEVAVNLRTHGYDVTKRSVRDKFKAIRDQVIKRNNTEKRESGIAPEYSDVDKELTQLVEDLVELETEKEMETRDHQEEEEKKKLDGVEMRKRAMESFSETEKRLKSEKEAKQRKKRNTGSDATQFLMMKLEMDRDVKEQELALRREEAKMRQEYEERKQQREEREEERRREREEREEAKRRKDELERERRLDLLQQQLMQQNQMIMMMLKNQQQQ